MVEHNSCGGFTPRNDWSIKKEDGTFYQFSGKEGYDGHFECPSKDYGQSSQSEDCYCGISSEAVQIDAVSSVAYCGGDQSCGTQKRYVCRLCYSNLFSASGNKEPKKYNDVGDHCSGSPSYYSCP